MSFGAINLAYWANSACFRGFIVAYALSVGFQESVLTVVMAAGAIAAVAGILFWSRVADKLGSHKKATLLCVLLLAPIQLLLCRVTSAYVFYTLYLLLCFIDGPCYAIIDSWCLRSISGESGRYGQIRSYGAASYAVIMVLTGELIRRFGYGVMLVQAVLWLVMMIAAVLAAPDAEKEEKQAPASQAAERGGKLRAMLRYPDILLLALVMLLLGCSVMPVSSLKIVLLTELGGSVATQGWDSFFACSAQFFVFLYVHRILRVIPQNKQLLGCCAIICAALLIDCLATSYWMVIVGSVCISAAYGLLIPVVRGITARSLPQAYQMRANGLLDSMYGSVASVISLSFAGRIVETAGVKTLTILSAIFSFLALLLVLLSLLHKRAREGTVMKT